MKEELFIYRDKPSALDTPGIFVFNNDIICHSLEDYDRGLTSEMSVKEIQKIKVYGSTAIPYGRYPIEWYDSPKHGRVPLLKKVKGFSYVEIHPANWATQLLGCIAPGMNKTKNVATEADDFMVTNSRKAFDILKKLIYDHEIEYINILKQSA